MTGNEDAITRACAAAAAVLAVTQAEQAQWYAEGGAERVAAMGFPNATPQQQAEKAALYERLQKQGASAA